MLRIVDSNTARVSVCLNTGTDVEQVVICGPHMRPDCLPSVTAGQYFGLSLWTQNDSTVACVHHCGHSIKCTDHRGTE